MSTKKLFDILPEEEIIKVIGREDVVIEGLQIDSRQIDIGQAFIALKGYITDGHKYIDMAIDKGAKVIFCEEKPDNLQEDITYVIYKNGNSIAGKVANKFYDQPSRNLTLIGVTGTNGKSSCVTLLHRLFTQLGYKVGLISTIENKIGNKVIDTTHTTPDAIALNSLLEEMVDSGCEYVFMEVSSHALHQGRVAGLTFAGGAFTNISHDHINYHKTFKEYIRVKKSFFDNLDESAFAISNIDDKNGRVMMDNCKSEKSYYGLLHPCDYKGKIIDNTIEGLYMDINDMKVHFSLSGKFNAYNLLTVYAIADKLEVNKEEAIILMSSLKNAEGRFDKIINHEKGITAIVDYAHTPDALENVIETINEIKRPQTELITVIGCGGNRDKSKRPIMAAIASAKSGTTILTSDNPRDEDPNIILDEMEKGIEEKNINKVLRIVDRKEAIRTACRLAQQGDIILVAGKGHEKVQEIKGEKFPFDDKKILKAAML